MLFNPVIAQLTLRQALARRRWIAVALLGLLPVVMAVLIHLYNIDDEPITLTVQMLSTVNLTVIVPLIALILASATLGTEVEDGTVIYLLTKPISRTTIAITKVLTTAAVAVLVNVVSTFLAGVISLGELDKTRLVLGFTVAAALGSLLYGIVFLTMGLLTRRGMLIGLCYLVVWEGALSSFFAGTRTLSIRQYMLSVTDAIKTADPAVFSALLPHDRAYIMSGAVAVVALGYCIHRLRIYEIGQAV